MSERKELIITIIGVKKCSYFERCANLAFQKSKKVTVIVFDTMTEFKKWLKNNQNKFSGAANHTSSPLIIVNGKYIGGCDNFIKFLGEKKSKSRRRRSQPVRRSRRRKRSKSRRRRRSKSRRRRSQPVRRSRRRKRSKSRRRRRSRSRRRRSQPVRRSRRRRRSRSRKRSRSRRIKFRMSIKRKKEIKLLSKETLRSRKVHNFSNKKGKVNILVVPLEIYSNNSCPACHHVEKECKRLRIPYRKYNRKDHEDKVNRLTNNYKYVPVIFDGNKNFIGGRKEFDKLKKYKRYNK